MIPEDDSIEWDEEDDSDDSLEIDNELLRARLGLSEEDLHKSGHTTPYIENQFLRNILAFQEADEGPAREIRDLFPDGFEFPPAASLDKARLREKLRIIETVLREHRIFLDLTSAAPDEVVYEYFITEAMYGQIPLELPEGFGYHLDGCDGYCPECFQGDFCELKKEIYPEDSEGDEQDVSSE